MGLTALSLYGRHGFITNKQAYGSGSGVWNSCALHFELGRHDEFMRIHTYDIRLTTSSIDENEETK